MDFKFFINEKTEDLYPIVEIPIKNKDISFIYDYFNKKIFNSKLIVPRLKIAPLAKNYYGKAHVKYSGNDYKIKDSLITISAKIVNEPKLFMDTLIHEMIHIWQCQMNEKSKSYKYSEATWSEIMGSNDKHTYGHNSYFIDEMSRINKMGYNITIEGDAPIGTELTDKVYGIVFYNKSNSAILLWHPENPTKYIDVIIDDIQDRKGDIYTDYTIFDTKESNITLSTRLTKTFKLPKNVINIEFKKEWVDDIFNTGSKLLDVKIQVEPTSKKVPNEIIDMVTKTAKYRGSSFDSYLKTVWLNTYKSWGSIKGTELYSKGNTFKGIKYPNDLAEEAVQYIYDNWIKISDAEVKRADIFKYFVTNYKYSIAFKKDLQRGVQDLKDSYDSDFADRVSIDKFKIFAKDKVIAELKKEAKKYNKNFDLEKFEILYKEKTKGTFLY